MDQIHIFIGIYAIIFFLFFNFLPLLPSFLTPRPTTVCPSRAGPASREAVGRRPTTLARQRWSAAAAQRHGRFLAPLERRRVPPRACRCLASPPRAERLALLSRRRAPVSPAQWSCRLRRRRPRARPPLHPFPPPGRRPWAPPPSGPAREPAEDSAWSHSGCRVRPCALGRRGAQEAGGTGHTSIDALAHWAVAAGMTVAWGKGGGE